jgi:type III restriction enzyme
MDMAVRAQFHYTTLAHQTEAVQAIADVFQNVRFVPPVNVQANPTIVPHEAAQALRENLTAVRARNHVSAGDLNVPVTHSPALGLDVLMETGTGKTFTFIETIHRLHRDNKLSKFIVLVPSNAIRQGTLKSFDSTAAFFAKQYDQRISVYNYSAKTVGGFIHAPNGGISVLVATYQSFAGDNKVINQRGVEASLFGRAKSFMEALAVIRPVLIIDEPHRFEGKQTQEYLGKFNPVLTLRFGATFKEKSSPAEATKGYGGARTPLGARAGGDTLKYNNLVYTLDSLEAFRQRLVKGIVVDTVGSGDEGTQALCYLSTHGTAKERCAMVSFQSPAGKSATVELRAKDNLGVQTGIGFLDGHVVETVAAKEVLFTNGFALPLGEAKAYGMLAEQTQSLIVERAVSNHFEREEELFKRGIKALSLFFIDAVAKYLPVTGKPAELREAFEFHYRAALTRTLAKPDLHPPYRAYLARSAGDVSQVHRGYFARSHSEKGEEEAIKLILQEKEKLLSFDTDLRFIFSMWALQEGWDNPNVFTLCKLAPSHSKISKLQQIGRGLRLAVNQQLERLPACDPGFEGVNELVVVVPASEGDFVAAIQSEIAAHSVRRVARVFDDGVLAEFGVAPSTRVANRVLDALASLGVITLDDVSGSATLVLDRSQYHAHRNAIIEGLRPINGLGPDNARAMLDYLDAYYDGYGQVKSKQAPAPQVLRVNPGQFAKFKALWDSLNQDAVLTYELDTPELVNNIVAAVERDFQVRPLTLNVTRTEGVQNIRQVHSTQTSYEVKSHSVYTLAGFLRELTNATKLSFPTVAQVLARMPAVQFAQIRHNEGRAFSSLRDVMLGCVYELLVHKVSYQLTGTRVKTALTDNTGQLLDTVKASLCGAELHPMVNAAVRARSLYDGDMMPVDSQIERDTVDDSQDQRIAVFAKLPRVNIPTPTGNYNPDFGYALLRGDRAEALYMVVETKGYDQLGDIPSAERHKITSAKRFFQALREQGTPVEFHTKLNRESLAQVFAQLHDSVA